MTYGQQEYAVRGYNPTKQGRPSHVYQTYSIAAIRMALDVEVQPGNQSASIYAQPGLWAWLDRRPRQQWPARICGDIGWGTEVMMEECEQRQLPYLFKIRQTTNVKKHIAGSSDRKDWQPAGGEWQGMLSELKLCGWTKKRQVMVLRRAAYRVAEVVDQQTDLINATINELVRQKYELPAFSTIDRIVERVHAVEHRRVFGQALNRLSPEQAKKLDDLLEAEVDQRFTAFNSLKDLPKRSTVSHLETLLNHLDWLDGLGDFDSTLEGIPPATIWAFAREARVLDASDFKRFTPPKRYTLLLSMIHQTRISTRDDIAEMFLKRVSTIEKRAKQELSEIQLAQRSRAEKLAIALDDVLDFIDGDISDLEAGQQLRSLLSRNGAVAKLRGDCAAVKEWDNDNYLSLLWKYYRSHRKVLFRLARVLKLQATNQDHALLDALTIVLRRRRANLIPANEVDLSFATARWHKLMYRERNGGLFVLRRQLEVCVFYHVAAELKSDQKPLPIIDGSA